MDNFDVAVRVEGPGRLVVEWPVRLEPAAHAAARDLILKVHGVDGVSSTVYREVVSVASHITLAELAAQDIANALLDDSAQFFKCWRGLGYADITVSTSLW